MTSLTHLLDDPSLGGVTRFLDALDEALGPAIPQTRRIVDARRPTPPTGLADVVVVHATMSWAKLPFLLALRVACGRKPLVLVEHSYTDAYESRVVPSAPRFRAMLKLAYALADRVVAVSYGQAAWMRRARLLPATKLAVIPPFTRCKALASIPLPAGHDGPLRLCAWGRYTEQKGFVDLIAAMRLVEPGTATLTLRGFGPEHQRLVDAAAGLRTVDVGPEVMDLATLLASADAVVVPSLYEPFGQVALEARLASRPLIVTEVDGLPEQADDGAGLVVPPADPACLASAITELATRRRDRTLAAMAAAARGTALDHAAASTAKWRDLLVELAGAGRRAGEPPAARLPGTTPAGRTA